MTRRSSARITAVLFLVLSVLTMPVAIAQTAPASPQSSTPKPTPEETEVWSPEPVVVTPGAACGAPPSDAIILFDGKNLDEWVSANDHTPAQWIVAEGMM